MNYNLMNIISFFTRPFSLGSPTGGGVDRGVQNYSGKAVTAGTVLTISTVWACVRLICESIAGLPVGAYVKDNDGNKIPQTNRPIYDLLHYSPNADMTAFDFWMVIIGSILLWGNSYALITRRDGGDLISLEPLNPAYVNRRKNANGSYSYVYTEDGKQFEYAEDEIWHLKGLTLNGKEGLSVIQFGVNSMGNALALDESSGRLYSNGMRPGGALTVAQVLKKDQRDDIRKNIADQIGGVAKTGGTIILEAGMKYENLTIPPADAQMLESKSYSVGDICRWFGVQPTMIGHTEKSTTWGTGLEHMNIGFLTYTLRPHLIRIEQSARKYLLTASERAAGVFMEFNIEGFLRADSAGRAALYSSAAQNGWMSRKEIRQKENLPFMPGSEKLTVQSALVNLEDLGKTAPVAPADKKGYILNLTIPNYDIPSHEESLKNDRNRQGTEAES